jgi:hypothetical protein
MKKRLTVTELLMLRDELMAERTEVVRRIRAFIRGWHTCRPKK